MKGTRFETIRWILWLGIFVVLLLAGCGPSASTYTSTAGTSSPTIMPTSVALICVPPPPTPAALSPHGTPSAATPSAETEAQSGPVTCFTPVFSMPIVKQTVPKNNKAGWRHEWYPSDQPIQVQALAADGMWVWIATPRGLFRLDLHRMEYKLFLRTTARPLSNIQLDHVYTLLIDDQGRLWAGGEYGLARYADNEGWKLIYTKSEFNNFAIDNDGNLWRFTFSGRYPPQAFRFQGQEPPAVGAWEPEHIGSQASFQDGSNWRFLALRNAHREEMIDASGSLWSYQHLYIADTFFMISRDGQVVQMCQEETSCPSGYYDELALYRDGQLLQRIPLLYGNVQTLAAAAQGGIWIGVENGLLYSDGRILEQYQLNTDGTVVSYPFIYSLAVTNDGSKWAATSRGLFRFSEEAQAWCHVVEMGTLSIEGSALVAPHQQSGLWLLGDGALSYIDKQVGQRWPLPNDVLQCEEQLHTMVEFQGSLWVAAGDCDLWRFDGQTWSKALQSSIIGLAQYRNTQLYAAKGVRDMLVYEGITWQQLPDCVACHWAYPPIAVDAEGRVWKTDGTGIWSYHADEGWRWVLKLEGRNIITSMLIDSRGDLWVADFLNGLIHCKQENCVLWNWDFGDNKPSEPLLTTLAEDLQGRIWIGGLRFLSVYDPAAER